MKIRNGFVSNSSSSSFIISEKEYESVFALAEEMIKDRNDDDWIESNTLDKLYELREYGIDENSPISFMTCNYDTYIMKHKDKYLVATCNNHEFKCEEFSGGYNREDICDELGIRDIEYDLNIFEFIFLDNENCIQYGTDENKSYDRFNEIYLSKYKIKKLLEKEE
jgi:hypothetical protein